jgi:hypothetical protein
VLADGQPLPLLLGRRWHRGQHPAITFHFYKKLTPAT